MDDEDGDENGSNNDDDDDDDDNDEADKDDFHLSLTNFQSSTPKSSSIPNMRSSKENNNENSNSIGFKYQVNNQKNSNKKQTKKNQLPKSQSKLVNTNQKRTTIVRFHNEPNNTNGKNQPKTNITLNPSSNNTDRSMNSINGNTTPIQDHKFLSPLSNPSIDNHCNSKINQPTRISTPDDNGSTSTSQGAHVCMVFFYFSLLSYINYITANLHYLHHITTFTHITNHYYKIKFQVIKNMLRGFVDNKYTVITSTCTNNTYHNTNS